MSQIGYMMFSMGLARYGGEPGLGFMASMFHLFTHAFFKSLLFLCAGVIIHLVHSNEMGDMGGLRRHMPLTHICFLVACLAIAGIPPFAGFFSKEEILTAAYHSNRFVYVVALIISGLTAFYMFRLYFSIFWRKPAADHHNHSEGNWAMKGPLLILAVCSLMAGWLPFSRYVSSDGYPLETHIDLAFSVLPVLLALVGIGLAARLYKTDSERPARVAAGFGAIYRVARQKFYIDEVYIFVTKKIIFNGIGRPAAWIDRNVVDGTMNGLAHGTARISAWIKGMQSGRLQSYTLYFFGGIALLTVLVIYYWQ
jgi:NADH-quinone oxidoreductase subunit L